MSGKKTLDLETIIDSDSIARDIAQKFVEWNSFRSEWIHQKRELRNYVYATDTTTTTNNSNGWSNSTTTPYLCQIYDNLKANYTSSLFPSSQWMKWSGDDKDSSVQAKRTIIQAYMENKTRQSGFQSEADKIIDDYILYGNCFATTEFVQEYNEVDGNLIAGYIGPRMVRISPFDIVFDPTASSFKHTPKVIRSLVSLGVIKDMADKGSPEMSLAYEKAMSVRKMVSGYNTFEKADGYIADGFSSITNYYASGSVELLTFYGDLFDMATGTVYKNHKIVIMDRAYVISNEPVASWLGRDPVHHTGWRNRPDNLYAMGPLDNLVGMQYRMDHLENLKADVFDFIALPMLKIRGDVEDFEHRPGGRIYTGEEGDVVALQPDATALNADFQIRELQSRMEEIAGAPRQAMGIRTPGEKTAFEVQSLENSASRIFQHKTAQLEREFFEPILNAMLESARRNMDQADAIRILDEETGALIFKEITKEDLTAVGKIVPMGARHFAERARKVQEINQLIQVRASDPSIGAHISGKQIAKMLTEEIGEETLYGENIAVQEATETQLAQADAQADAEEQMQVAAEEGL